MTTKNATAKLWNPYLWTDGSYRSYPQLIYDTSFPNTENPLSDGGILVDGSVFSPRTSAASTPGNGHGTMSSFDGTNYADSVTCLPSYGFSENHEVEFTILNNSAGTDLEVEGLLRATINASICKYYEIDFYHDGNDIFLQQADCTTGARNNYILRRAGVPGEVTGANGDKIRANIIGTIIRCYYRPVSTGVEGLLFTYDTVNDTPRIDVGSPGFGFWNASGNSANSVKLALSRYIARDL